MRLQPPLAIVVVLLAGCPHKTELPADAGRGCFEDSDCPSTRFHYCNTVTSECDPACKTRDDCSSAARGEFALASCDTALGCNCDQGTCRPGRCTADVECPGLLCRNGECVDGAALPKADRCELYPTSYVVPARLPFEVRLLATAGGVPVVPARVDWGAAAAGTGVSALVTPDAGAIVVEARAGSAVCSISVTAVSTADLLPTTVEAVVFDAISGQPISGATVAATIAGSVGPILAVTGASGMAQIPVGAASEITLTAFHDRYDYLTVVSAKRGVDGLPVSHGGFQLIVMPPSSPEMVPASPPPSISVGSGQP